MAKTEMFAFRLTEREKELLAKLAEIAQRTKGDTLCFIIRKEAERKKVTK